MPVDVIDWPGITVTEGAADEDTMLVLDLLRWSIPWEPK